MSAFGSRAIENFTTIVRVSWDVSATVRSGSTWSATATADMARLSIVTCSLLALGVLLLISGCTVAPTAPTAQRNADPGRYAGGSSLQAVPDARGLPN